MVAVISFDAYLVLAFSDLPCHLEDTGIDVFWMFTWQKLSAGKKTR